MNDDEASIWKKTQKKELEKKDKQSDAKKETKERDSERKKGIKRNENKWKCSWQGTWPYLIIPSDNEESIMARSAEAPKYSWRQDEAP